MSKLCLDACISALAGIDITGRGHCWIAWVLTLARCIGSRFLAPIPTSIFECMGEIPIFCEVGGLHIITGLTCWDKWWSVRISTLPNYTIVLPVIGRALMLASETFACLGVSGGRLMRACAFTSWHCSGNLCGTCDWESLVTRTLCLVPLSGGHDS